MQLIRKSKLYALLAIDIFNKDYKQNNGVNFGLVSTADKQFNSGMDRSEFNITKTFTLGHNIYFSFLIYLNLLNQPKISVCE